MTNQDFAPAELEVVPLADGGHLLRAAQRLREPLMLMPDRLLHWAEHRTEQPALAAREDRGWRRLSYRAVADLTARAASALLRLGLSPERPLAIIAWNNLDNALLRLAAQRAGVPFVPIAPGYLRLTGGYNRLRAILALTTPGLIFADDGAALGPAVAGLDLRDTQLSARANVAQLTAARSVDALFNEADCAALAERQRSLRLDDVAAIFFTSGSTGAPKGVITTHRMLSANQQAIAQIWPFIARRPPVLLDWLPWHHTFGGNDNFHKVIWNGGTLYIDDGQPTLERIGRTVENIRAAEPSIHVNVPRGLDLLLPHLEDDATTRAAFFRNMQAIFIAGAAVPQRLWERMRALAAAAEQATGRTIALAAGWGTTEAGSTICMVHFPTDRPGNVGLPLPGFDLKLVPVAGKLEARVKGPNVTPGYWRQPDLTRGAFDADGFYRTGDAVRFFDPGAPQRGLVFDGRIAEDFKLTTGTWVSVGALRLTLLAATAPLVQDVAIAGHDRDFVTILAFIDVDACMALCGGETVLAGALLQHPQIRARLAAALSRHNAANPGSSTAVRRAIMIAEPPSAASGEINDKGHLNQRIALDSRRDLIQELYAAVPSPHVLRLDAG
ncbi:MAG: AMP-binding protein [Proteobacteria bacterium]|nr:AMP-binding protein [Pseudomonadota bacterium]